MPAINPSTTIVANNNGAQLKPKDLFTIFGFYFFSDLFKIVIWCLVSCKKGVKQDDWLLSVFCVAETWFCGSTSTTEQLSKLHHKMSAKLWMRARATWFGDKEWIGPMLLCHKGCYQMNESIQLFAINPKTLTMSTTIRKSLAIKIYICIYTALSHHN